MGVLYTHLMRCKAELLYRDDRLNRAAEFLPFPPILASVIDCTRKPLNPKRPRSSVDRATAS